MWSIVASNGQWWPPSQLPHRPSEVESLAELTKTLGDIFFARNLSKPTKKLNRRKRGSKKNLISIWQLISKFLTSVNHGLVNILIFVEVLRNISKFRTEILFYQTYDTKEMNSPQLLFLSNVFRTTVNHIYISIFDLLSINGLNRKVSKKYFESILSYNL